MHVLRHNRTRIITITILVVLFATAIQGMETKDWTITVLRGLSVGAVTFLVASGLSLILGLMDVLNLAHGEMFMLGAYVGWTVFIRPDTFVDLLPVLLLIGAGFVLLPLWRALLQPVLGPAAPASLVTRLTPWLLLFAALIVTFISFRAYPLSIWDPEVYAQSPITFSLMGGQGTLTVPAPPESTMMMLFGSLLGVLLGACLLAAAVVAFRLRNESGVLSSRIGRNTVIYAAVLLIGSVVVALANDPLTEWMVGLPSTARFFVAIGVATVGGFILGALVEMALIRPLYDRPIYQLMITLGLGFILVELVRIVWGRPEFTMPKPSLFAGSGDGCPATNVPELLSNSCSTVVLFDGRVRTYNEIFVILIGVAVLIGVWVLLQRTRLGMVIRAGVQDSEMVEALGINVRRVFMLVFALGVALAALGGVIAAPSTGLSTAMGTQVLLLALIALAIGGLTSFPGAAAGAVLVGLLQQFIIKYGQIGINLPFMAEPFKPSPPLVPASVILLMVVILLVLPNGLFGRSE